MTTKLKELIANNPEIVYLRHEESMPTASHASDALGIDASKIAKTCIIKTSNNEYVAVVLQGSDRIDKDALKTLLGCKKFSFASAEEVLEKSGYIAGGTPPIGLKEAIVRVILDRKVFQHEKVYAGGGEQKALICITPQDVQRLSHAEVADISC